MVEAIGNFDERLENSEDRDYIMRFMSKHIVLGLPMQMGVHYTIAYRNIKRTKEMLFNLYYLYFGVVLRKNIFHPKRTLVLIKSEYGIFLGSLFLPLLFLSIFTTNMPVRFVLGVFILGDLFLGMKKEAENIIGRFIAHYIFSLYAFLGFFFYFPKHKKTEWYEIH